MGRRIGLLVGVGSACALAVVLAYPEMGQEVKDTTTTTPKVDAAAMNPLLVLEQNKDASGSIRVHEQGTVPIIGTVSVNNMPGVQDVRVQNTLLPIAGIVQVQNTPLPISGTVQVSNLPATTGTTVLLHEVLRPFTEPRTFLVDISRYSKIRIFTENHYASGVNFDVSTDGGISEYYTLHGPSDNSRSEVLEVAGTELQIIVTDPDGEEVVIKVFGAN